MSHLAITGATVGGMQPRLEINNFVTNDKYFSLYVQAWQKMQDESQNDLQSFFQAGGIHGLPFISWNGAGSQSQSPSWGGYCTHGSTLFPTWHRPYVALVEQILSGYAQQIASSYSTPDGPAWKQASQELRFPYWDWAQNTVPPPEVISLDQVNITAQDGSRKLVPNPLRRYRFHPIDPSFPAPFSQWQTTLRQPTSSSPNTTENIPALRSILQGAQNSTTVSTFNMLTRINNWGNFSNHNVNGGSLESIHDGIHVMVGGNGHMSFPAVAAFDPIFFLHHCNVDRMLSLWSAINLGSWVTPGNAGSGTFTLPIGAAVDINTPLTPFWINQTSFWPSSATTNTASLGYTYPEFVGVDSSNPTTLRTAILAKVNTLYGGASRRALTRLGSGTTGQLREWTARVTFDNQEVGNSFSILFFLGDVPEDPSQWLLSSTKVGGAHAFVSNHDGAKQNDPLQEGSVLLNDGIANHSGLKSFDPTEVRPYLKANLHWRVLKADGTPAKLQSLKITVLEVPVSMPSTGARIPVAGKPIEHGDITDGRSG